MAAFETYQKICEEMKMRGLEKKESIFSAGYTYIYGILIPIPIMIVLGGIYFARWGNVSLFDWQVLYVLVGICFTIIVHELIHGIVWSFFCKDGFRRIKFGVNKGMPYCHCESPLKKKGYIAGAIAPLIVLASALFITSLFVQSASLFILMQLNVLLAGGDLLIVMKAVNVQKNAYFIDHPNLPGFVTFGNN